MTSWEEEYLAALEDRDRKEKANKGLIDQYTKLADRTATLLQQRPDAGEHAQAQSSADAEAATPSSVRNDSQGKGNFTNLRSQSQSPAVLSDISQLRADLALSQRTRAALESEVRSLSETLSTLKKQSASDRRELTEQSRANSVLERKVRDRDEEIHTKQEMVREVQDEMVVLGLQVNMLEKKKADLENENKDLVNRWMERMGKEADDMNRESRW